MLPHLAQHAVRYDDQTHQLHAYTWQGDALHVDTPGELVAAIHAGTVYAPAQVAMMGTLLAYHHGLDVTQYATMLDIDITGFPQSVTAWPAHIARLQQRLDRAHEKTARLALELLSDDDVLEIIDAEGLFAQYCVRLMQRESAYPTLPVRTTPDATQRHADTTLLLWCAQINDDGVLCDATVQNGLHDCRDAGQLAYVIAAQGPHPCTTASTPLCPTAVITSRGIYRADRVMRYRQDSDLGSDIIALQ